MKRFPQSEGIATLESLIVLDHILTTYEIKKVLEIGRGLGTLTKFMSENSQVEINSIETDTYCIRKSAEILSKSKYRHFTHIQHISNHELSSLDLVVIDGPIPSQEFKLLFQGTDTRIYFFENHQIISKMRIFKKLFSLGRTARYVELFPYHNFQGASYIISLPRQSYWVFLSNNLAHFIIQTPRLLRFIVNKIRLKQHPFSDSYFESKWNPTTGMN